MDADRGADGQALRRHNMALLLRLLVSGSPESRAALSTRTGLTKATVSALTAELIEAGLVQQTGARAADRPGRPATWLGPDPLGPVGVGLVLGEAHIAGYLVDLTGAALAKELRRLDRGTEHALRLCRPVLRKLLDTATSAGRFVAGVTLAAAPALAPEQLVAPLRAELAALGAYGIEVTAGNAVDYAAAAEARATGQSRLLYLGGDGELCARLLPGEPAGELGHLPVRRRGPRCRCGATGCLELSLAEPDTAVGALETVLRPILAVAGPRTVVLGGRLRGLPAEPLAARLAAPVRQARLGADAPGLGAATAALAHITADPAAWIGER